jgi:hypothetical protein
LLSKGFVNVVPATTNTHATIELLTGCFLCGPCRMKYSVCGESVYGVQKVQMHLPGRCVSAGTLVRNYGATNVALNLERPTPPLVEEDTPFPNT